VYFHDGSPVTTTLRDIVNHYNKGDDIHNPFLDQDILWSGRGGFEINRQATRGHPAPPRPPDWGSAFRKSARSLVRFRYLLNSN